MRIIFNNASFRPVGAYIQNWAEVKDVKKNFGEFKYGGKKESKKEKYKGCKKGVW